MAATGSAVAAVLAAAAIAFGATTGPADGSITLTPFGITVLLALAFLSYALVGSLIVRRAGWHPIGAVLLIAGLLFEGGLAAENFAKQRAVAGDADGWSAAASWFDAWAWGLAVHLVLVVLILFPDRRPATRLDRVLLVLAVAASAGDVVAVALAPGPLDGGSHQLNPLGVDGAAGVLDTLGAVSAAMIGLVAVATVVVVVLRYRRATGDRRQQLRWLALAAAVSVTSLVLAALGAVVGLEVQAAAFVVVVVALPAAMAVAVLRYHLYDIDVVVNRLLVYGSLIAVITAVYVGVTATAAAVTGAEPGSAVSIGAAVAVAVIVLPVRQRLQRLADRIVLGRRATPYQALAGFVEQTTATTSVDDLAPRLADLLADATGADATAVYVRVDDGLVAAGCRPSEPRPARLPVHHGRAELGGWDATEVVEQGHELLGALALRMPAGVPVREADHRIMRHLAAQAAVAFETLRLNAELRGSRQRLVEAQELERRRIGRDLHDGAQQDLVALIAKSMLARRQLVRDPDLADATLQELQADVRNALNEVRRLAQGVFPQLLADRGLVAAVAARASRCPVPVAVDADGTTDRRFDPAVEGAAWFVVSEALTNVVKHAHATSVVVRMRGRRRVDHRGGGRRRRRGRRRSGLGPGRDGRPGRRPRRPGDRRVGRRTRHRRPLLVPDRPRSGRRRMTRVVLAEDNYLVREGTRRLLEDSGRVEVVAAVGDATALLAAVSDLDPDVVITDIRMPPDNHLDGIVAAHRIREAHPEIGVVVLSQHLEDDYALELFKHGTAGYAYLLKERVGDLDQLLAAIDEVSAGRSVIDPDVVDVLIARRIRPGLDSEGLTPRELEVLHLMAQGRTNAAIAGELFLSESAIEKHINAIFTKLGLNEEKQIHRRVKAVLTYLERR